jgi:hypothetical protein
LNNYPRRIVTLIAGLSLACFVGLSGSPALASTTQGGPDTPSGPQQSASWTSAQLQVYANKLQHLATLTNALGLPASHPYVPQGLPKPTVGTSTTLAPSIPTSYSIPIYNDPEPNSYYGYQCGPAAGHNALGAYGVNIPISTLTTEMGTTPAAGTARNNMQGPINSHESQNTYVWQTLGTPAGNPNGIADLRNYTTLDIWAMDSPIYNFETYGFDPIQNAYRYPFSQYSGVDIQHYVTAYAYSSGGDYISISDSAVKYSYTASQEYNQYYKDIWAAIHNHPALDAILW